MPYEVEVYPSLHVLKKEFKRMIISLAEKTNEVGPYR
jgi:hypothetical protein